jgi:hypothetical protein
LSRQSYFSSKKRSFQVLLFQIVVGSLFPNYSAKVSHGRHWRLAINVLRRETKVATGDVNLQPHPTFLISNAQLVHQQRTT